MPNWRSKLKFEVYGETHAQLQKRAQQVIIAYFDVESYENVTDLIDVEMEVMLDSRSLEYDLDTLGYKALVYVKIK